MPVPAGLPTYAAPTSAIEASAPAALDAALAALTQGKSRWAALAVAELLALLDELLRDVNAVGQRWVDASVAAKGAPPGGMVEGEEWLHFSIVTRLLRQLRISLEDVQASGRPRTPRPLSNRPNGQVVAQVFPRDRWDRYSLPGVSGEVWMTPGQSSGQVLATQALAYRPSAAGKLTLVLGAGNASPLVPGDFLHHIFVERSVVLLKMNPVNAYLGPFIEEGFRALTRQGALAVVYGGAPEGDYLCHHPLIDAIHMTGSDKTFEAIVFGGGAEGAQRKAERTPLLQKSITAELGNITPVIVVPGPWTKQDMYTQANRLVSQCTINAAFNCLTPRLVVNWRHWPLRQFFLDTLYATFAAVPTRAAYYPGAHDRHARFVAAHPSARHFGQPAPGHLPWTVIPDLPSAHDDIAFRSESFCSVLAETAVHGANAADFIDRAVAFVNNRVWGTLAVILVVHPKSAHHPGVAAALERALNDLRYGTIVVNQPTVLAYMLCTTPWGAFPGQPPNDIQSGVGFVNNPLMFAHPQKSIVRGPFQQAFDAYQPRHRHLAAFGRHFAAFQTQPSAGRLMRALWALMRA